VQSLSTIIATFNSQIAALEKQVTACFGRTRDAEIYLSQPGLGQILAARVLGEFGDDPERYASAKARKNYAGTSPITQQSGKKKVVLARFIRNDRLADPLHRQAFCALSASPGARAYYDQLRAQHQPPRRIAAAVKPAGRHLARQPEKPNPLRRAHRLETSRE
jgi:transposase